jgi:leucyl-tRNA synthetase
MDTFVDSSWYFLRYTSPHEESAAFDPQAAQTWCPVNQYTGGAEHAVMHLLYARFFIKALRDLGLVEFDEPFERLFNQGTIISNHQKMSKSRGNVIAPDSYVEEFGADVVRCYLMFLGPWDQGGDWMDSGINGTARFLNRVWELSQRDARTLDDFPADDDAIRELQRLQHKTIRRVGDDLERFKFNTALAGLMEFTNSLGQIWDRKGIRSEHWSEAVEKLTVMVAPMAPHVSDEMWEKLGHSRSVHTEMWPSWDPELAADEVFTLVVQVNGRVRDKIEAPVDIAEDAAKSLALESERVTPYTEGKELTKVIYVPGKLVNIVAR